ncbi:MAG: DUF29 family protein [Microcystaceae cyanobacterium]
MVQELIDLRQSIEEGRYDDALLLVDELEEMSKQAIIRNIESYLLRLFIHLIKNQVEKRWTNSWVASITDSIRQIQKLNLKGNKKSYYIKSDQWDDYLEDSLIGAIIPASAEVFGGTLKPKQLQKKLNTEQLKATVNQLLQLTYRYYQQPLLDEIEQILQTLPEGKNWFIEE